MIQSKKIPIVVTVFILLSAVVTSVHLQANTIISGEELFKTPYYTVPQISPDGKFVIGKVDDGEKRELVITDVNAKKRYPVIFFAKRNYLRNFYWIDSDSIYIEYISGKKNKNSIVNVDVNNLAVKQPAQQISAEGYLLSSLPEVENQVLFARRLSEDDLEIYQIATSDLVNGNFASAQKFESHLKDAFFYSYNDQNSAFFGLKFDKDENAFSIWFLAPNKKTWRLLYDSDNLSFQLKPIQYLSDNKFLVLTNQITERMSVAVFDLVSQKVEKIVYEDPKHDIISAEADDESGELISVTFLQHGEQEVLYFKQELADIENYYMDAEDDDPAYTVDTSADGTRSIVLAYGASHPGTYILFDEKTQSTQLIEHQYPSLIEHEFAKTRRIEMELASGETQEGFLTLPYLNGNGTLLIMLEAGSTASDKMTEFSPSVQYLASRGYAILRLDYQSPVEFIESDTDTYNVRMNTLLESDINELVEYVKQRFNYDKACPIGYGYGGYSALRMSMLYQQNYQCVISLFGIYDLQLLFSANNAEALKLNQQAIKELLQNQNASFVEKAPVYLAKGFNKPVLMVAGENDDVAIPEQFNRMSYVLERQIDDLENYIYSDVGHGFERWFQELQFHAVIDDFLRRHLSLAPLEEISDNEVAAEEYVVISDMFAFDTLTENKASKSFEYLVKASRLGHPRAMFNHGAHFHRGDLVSRNFTKAMELYQKASEVGYASASYRVAEFLSRGTEVDQDLPKAYEYYLLADQQGHDARAGLKAARYVCKGEVVERDVDLCKRLFDIKKIRKDNLKNRQIKVDENSKKLWRSLFPDLMLASGNTTEQQAFYKRLLYEEFEIVDVKAQFELVEEGIFTNAGLTGHKKTTDQIPMTPGVKFGVRFRLNKQADSTENSAIIVQIFRTTEKQQKAVIRQRIEQKSGRQFRQDWYIDKELSSAEAVPSLYEIQIYNLDAELLYSKTFNVGSFI